MCVRETPPSSTHVDDGLLRLCHVGDDAISDDEQNRILGAILHSGGIPVGVGIGHKGVFLWPRPREHGSQTL